MRDHDDFCKLHYHPFFKTALTLLIVIWTTLLHKTGYEEHIIPGVKPLETKETICKDSPFKTHFNLSKFFDYCDQKQCTFHKHFVFLKKHKCASTSLEHLLKSVIHKHNLVYAKPSAGPFIGGYPGRFKSDLVWPKLKEKSKYDTIVHHMRFDHEEVSKLVYPDTIYISTVRDVESHLDSIWNYYYKRFHTEEKMKSKPCNFGCFGQPILTWKERYHRYIQENDLSDDLVNFITFLSDGNYDDSTSWSLEKNSKNLFYNSS